MSAQDRTPGNSVRPKATNLRAFGVYFCTPTGNRVQRNAPGGMGHMGQMWSTVRRRALIGLVAAVCAASASAPGVQAASSKKTSNEIPAVGTLQVVDLP